MLLLSGTQEGRKADKQIADFAGYRPPQGSHLLQDLGFLAFTLDGVGVLEPFKKPRGGCLSEEQKAANQAHAARRVRIEHAINGESASELCKTFALTYLRFVWRASTAIALTLPACLLPPTV